MSEISQADPLNVGQYYLQVQALTPVAQRDPDLGVDPTTAKVMASKTLLPQIIFLVIATLLLVGMLSGGVLKLAKFSRSLKVLGLILVLPVSLWLMNSRTRIESQAGPEHIPKNVVVSSVTTEGFDISWDTSAETYGVIRMADNKLMVPILMVEYSQTEESTRHLVKVRGLVAGKEYFVEILSEESWYDNGGEPLVVKTLE